MHNAGTYSSSNVNNGNTADYASANQGINTFLNFDFGGPVSFDTVVVINRNSAAGSDWIANYTLTYADNTSTSIIRTAQQGKGGYDSLGSLITTTSVRLDVDTLGSGTIGNTGAMEIYFLRTPAGMNVISGVTVVGSSAAFSGYSASRAVDGIFGTGPTAAYASYIQGVNTYVDFDLGSLTELGGFDMFDRLSTPDHVTSFNMIISLDNIFGNGDDVVKSYTGSTQGAEFAGVSGRYVRYDVTGIGASNNNGLNEIRFFSVPEPSSAALLGLAGLVLILRRRKG